MTTASSFVEHLRGLGPLTPGAVADFGLDGGQAFGRINNEILKAYHIGWCNKVFTAEELAHASCSGPRLTGLLRRFHPTIVIKTVWDAMTTNDLEEAKG